jgi:hypothetical protein
MPVFKIPCKSLVAGGWGRSVDVGKERNTWKRKIVHDDSYFLILVEVLVE